MVMDVLVLAIFITTIFFCMHRGFTVTIINFIRCIAAILLAFLFCDNLRDFFLQETPVGPWVKEKLQNSIGNSAAEGWQDAALYQNLPESLRGQSDAWTSSFVDNGLDKLASTMIAILSFLLIVIAVNLAVAIFIKIFSKKYAGGFFGFLDWALGGIMGIVVGAFYVFLFLALILPAASLFSADLMAKITASFNSSHIAGELYDNNFLLILFRDLLN